MATAVVGSNFPDIDFLWQFVGNPSELSYLVHHRGYTHTLLAAIPQGLLIAGVVSGLMGLRLGIKDFNLLKLWILGVLSIWIHILFDGFNSYGVHPFFPVSNQWFYGDTLFIVEPLIWICLLAFFFRTTQSSIIRGWCLGIGVLTLGIGWISPIFPKGVALAVSLWGVLCVALHFRRPRVWVGWVSLFSVIGVFLFASLTAHELVNRFELPGETNVQIVLSPAPSNPACWHLVSVSHDSEYYMGRVGLLSLWPTFFEPKKCGSVRFESILSSTFSKVLIPIESTQLLSQNSIHWVGQFKRPLKEFFEWSEDCRFKALLKFSRAPYWWTEEGVRFAGDLRYPMSQSRSFFRAQLDQGPCLDRSPPWEPPVKSILDIKNLN